MKTNVENGVSTVTTPSTDVTTTDSAAPIPAYSAMAQERLMELMRWREQIPNFSIPAGPDARRRLTSAASVPPEFIELTNVALANQTSLVRQDGATPDRVREMIAYADTHGPLANELEALAHFVRYSVTAARNAAGTEALTTYSLAQRMAKRPEYAHLKPYVADMRRALRRGRKVSLEDAAQRAAERAAKAAEKAAAKVRKQAAQLPAPDPVAGSSTE